MGRFRWMVAFAALLVPASAIGAQADAAIDWGRYAEERTVTVITTNEDGSARETTVWLVVVDGEGYIRTGRTRWGGNVERNPDVVLRVGEDELPLRAELIQDPSVREKVMSAFREKYGIEDRITGLIRGRNPKIMRLTERSPE